LLRKANVDLTWILPQVPIEIKKDLMLELRPTRILDQGVKELQNKRIPIVRILLQNTQIEEEIWEREFEMKKK